MGPRTNRNDDEGLSGTPLPASLTQGASATDTIRILLATDNHIGYAEKDPVRGRDSINTFREILQLAVTHDADMLLLAGDLFHENKPSRESLYLTIGALREYCLNSRPVSMEIISDVGIGLKTKFQFPQINYEDENFNVGLPVFSIHGNHDDPQGVGEDGALCALDVLSAAGLINYFGRQDLQTQITDSGGEIKEEGIQIHPILLQKGRTKLALYGIGNIRDERFHYELRSNRVTIWRPRLEDGGEDFFNLLLIHQNRVAHGPKNSVPDDAFGDEVDLVVWGHEHDCRIEPEQVPGKEYYITQPGSSIATSLAKGESIRKHVALLEIQDRDFRMTPLPLKTIRPFIFEEIALSDEVEMNNVDLESKVKVTTFLRKTVNEMIKRAKREWDELHPEDEDSIEYQLPLIRLRVEYSRAEGGAYEVGNPQRFGAEFAGKIANTKDVIQFYRKKRAAVRKMRTDIDLPENDMDVDGDADLTERVERVQVSTLVHQYLEAQNLGVLAENGMQKAVTIFVEKDDKDAIKDFYSEALKATWESMNSEDKIDENDMEKYMTKAKERYAEQWEKEENENQQNGTSRQKKKKGKKTGAQNDSDASDDSFGQMSEEQPAATTKRGKTTTSRGRATATKAALFAEASDNSEESEAPPPPPKKTGRAAAAPAKKAAPAKTATKKAANATQSSSKATQGKLNFSQVPARGAASRAAASKAKSKIQAQEEEEDEVEVDEMEEDSAFEQGDSAEEVRPKKKTTRSRR